jgi:hypothetical protein
MQAGPPPCCSGVMTACADTCGHAKARLSCKALAPVGRQLGDQRRHSGASAREGGRRQVPHAPAHTPA